MLAGHDPAGILRIRRNCTWEDVGKTYVSYAVTLEDVGFETLESAKRRH